MRIPIAHALAWPERVATGVARLDLAAIGRLEFEAPDPERFRALTLARHALQAGQTAPTILNAANEVAVAAFLAERIGFLDIVQVVETTLERARMAPADSLAAIAECDAHARETARAVLERAGGTTRTGMGSLA
jgi:1-deoxy-D-xylulose-5-phosphate reductoisomerase